MLQPDYKTETIVARRGQRVYGVVGAVIISPIYLLYKVTHTRPLPCFQSILSYAMLIEYVLRLVMVLLVL